MDPLLDRDLLNSQNTEYRPQLNQDASPQLPYVPLDSTTQNFGPLAIESMQSSQSQQSTDPLAALNQRVMAAREKGDGRLLGGSPLLRMSDVKSNRYDFILPGADNEDIYGAGQSILDKGANAIVKGLGLAATTAVQGTIGLVNGLGAAWQDGRLASFYDNPMNRSLDEFNKGLEDKLPNYYTAKETNADWLNPRSYFTANFLFDSVIKNMGFTLGAMASGYALGGLGSVIGKGVSALTRGTLLAKALNPIAKAFSVAESLSALEGAQGLATNTINTAERAAQFEATIKGLSDKVIRNFNINNIAQRAVYSGLGTIGEASFEALSSLNQYRDTKIQEYKDTHFGEGPTEEVLNQINEEAEHVGNWTMGLNTALLTATNYIQFPKILGSSHQAEKGIANGLFGDVRNIVKNKEGEWATKSLSDSKGLMKFAKRTKNWANYAFSGSEAFEEGAQNAIQVGTQEYFDKSKNPNNDVFSTIGKAIYETIHSKEGFQSILIGGLSGRISENIGQIRRGELGVGDILTGNYAKGERATAQEAAENLNKYSFLNYLKDSVDSVNRATTLQAQRVDAIQQGEILESKDLEHDYAHNYLANRIKYGRYDLVREDIENHRTLASTDEGFAQLQQEGKASPLDTRLSFFQRLNNFEAHANNIKSLYQSLNIRYKGVLDKEGNRLYPDEVLDKMIYASSKVADYEYRIPQVHAQLGQYGISAQEAINNLYNPPAAYHKAHVAVLDQINDLAVTDDVKSDLRQSFVDILEMIRRKKSFLDDYAELKRNPKAEKFQDTTTVPDPTLTPEEKKEAEEAEGNPIVNTTEDIVTKEKAYREAKDAALPTIEQARAGYTADTKDEDKIDVDLRENLYNAPNVKELQSIYDSMTDANKAQVKDFFDKALSYLSHLELDDATLTKLGFGKTDIERLTPEERVSILKNNSTKADYIKGKKKPVEPESGSIITPDPTEKVEGEKVPAKKDVARIVSSTHPPFQTPERDRNWAFLNNFRNLKNQANIRVITINQNTQKALGVDGITEHLMGGNPVPNDAKGGLIVMAYVEQDGKELHFVDIEGKRIGKVGDPIDHNLIVHTNLSSVRPAEEYILKEGDAYTIEQYQKAFEKRRATLLSYTGNQALVSEFTVSRGFPSINPTNASEKNPVSGTLVSNKDLDTVGLIKVPTEPFIVHNDVTLKFPVGKPLLVKGDTIEFLNNRNFSKKEATNIFNLLKELSKTFPDSNPQIINYLRGITFWGSPMEGKKVNSNQMWIDNGKINLGAQSFDFNVDNLNASQAQIIDHIQTMYNNVNNKYLTPERFNNKFDEIEADSEGNITSVKLWPNYQRFVLEAGDGAPFLSTRVRQRTSTFDFNYEGKYITLDKDSLAFSKVIGEGNEVPKTPPSSPISNSVAGIIFDGKTVNIFTTKSGAAIKYTATFDADKPEAEQYAVTIVQDDTAKGIIAKLDASPAAAGREGYGAVVLANLTILDIKSKVAEKESPQGVKEAKPIAVPKEEVKITSPDTVVTPKTEGTVKGEDSPAVQAAKLRKAALEKRGGSTRSESEFRIAFADKINYIRMSWPRAEAWMKANLPQVPFVRLKNLISTTSGGTAFGVFRNAAIHIYENAETGTTYHEAFHAVWNMFSTSPERRSMIDEFRRRKGIFVDRPTQKPVAYGAATETQIKEELAEEFRNYVQDGTQVQPRSSGISGWFKDLLNTIKNFLTRGTSVADFFKKINTGHYSTSPIITRSINSSTEDNYRITIENFNEQTNREIIENVASRFIQEVFEDGKSLIDLEEKDVNPNEMYARVYEKIRVFYEEWAREDADEAIINHPHLADEIEANYERISQIWENTKSNWTKIVDQNNEFLRQFGLQVERAESDDGTAEGIDSNEESDINNDDKQGRSDDYLRDVMKIDNRKAASTAVKLLFATLIETKPAGEPGKMPIVQFSSVEGQKLVKMAKSFNHVMHNISDSTSIDQMMEKLHKLSEAHPNYARLFRRLKGNFTTGKIDYSKLSTSDWRLLLSFFDSFAKQKPKALIQFTNEQGSTYTQPADLQDAVTSKTTEWLYGMKSLSRGDNPIISYNKSTKTYNVDSKRLEQFSTRNPESSMEFLKALSITFTPEVINGFTKKQREEFLKAAANIQTQLKKDPQVMTVSNQTLGITGSLNILANLNVRAYGDFTDSTFSNALGEKVQAHVQNNYLSLFLSDFNQVSTKDELFTKFPQLKDFFSQDSKILELGGEYFDSEGNRTLRPLTLGYIDGLIGPNGAKHSSQLSLSQRRMLEINQNLSGRYYTLVPADAKTEWLLELGQLVSYQDMTNNGTWNMVYSTFASYLSTEFDLAKANRFNSSELRFFKNILRPEQITTANKLIAKSTPEEIKDFINSAAVKKDLSDFINGEAQKTKEHLKKYTIISTKNKDKVLPEGMYTIPSLDSNFRTNENIPMELSEKDVDRILQMRTINFMWANIEMHKIMFGDPQQIKDPTKRIKSFLSGTSTSAADSNLDNHLNFLYNEGLKEGDPGYHTHKSYMHTVTLQDIISNGDIYEGANEADAQTWMSPETYREFQLKNAGAWTNKQQKQFEYEMAWERDYLSKKKDSKGKFKYIYSSPELKKKDEELLAPYREFPMEEGSFPIIKPKGSGVKAGSEFLELYLDKTSAAPIFLRHITQNGKINTNLANLRNKMREESIDYAIVESGRKIGATGLHPVYKEDGSFNTDPFALNTQVDIPFKNYSRQVETSGSKHTQTLGSQLTKLATMDLMEGGLPLDFEKELPWEERYVKWVSLTEEEKLTTSPMYGRIKENQTLLEHMAEDGYNKLLKKLSIKDTGTEFILEDKVKFQKFLKDELTRRDIDDNTLRGIEINPETGDFYIPLEANPRYIQIKNMLYSVVDKNIGSPKVNGGPKIQMSGAMWEEGKRIVKNGKLLVSDALKFYTKEEPWMEIYVPHWFKDKLEKAGLQGTDEEILTQINNSKILSGIGFRIPTQQLSSIDVFKIKGFLPAAMGDAVVVPAELTVKSGCDFDVDKLNSYLKNVHIALDGKIRLVEYLGSKDITLDFYRKRFDKALEFKTKKASEILEAIQVLMGEEGNPKLFDKYQKLLDAMMSEDAQAEDKREEFEKRIAKLMDATTQSEMREAYANKMYSMALENAYFQSLEDLLSLPENFERLTAANSDATLKGLRKKLDKLRYTEDELNKVSAKGNHALLLSPDHMSNLRHNFIIGKGGVGIAAVQQTNHSLNQRFPMYINTDLIDTLDPKEKEWFKINIVDKAQKGMKLNFGYPASPVSGEIKLPHNQITLNGKRYATLSGLKDKAGKYISDKISEYINGFVDIAKDAFIVEIGATPQLASIFMFLEKIGTPTEDVVMFMNQPIIRELVDQLSIKGWSSVINEQVAADIMAKFPSKAWKALQPGEMIDTTKFEGNISKYFRDKQPFTQEENIAQKQILREFMKIAVLSGHLFQVTQGSNYDTANFNDSNLLMFKQQQTEHARNQNLISSVDEIMKNSFIGKRAEFLGKADRAISEAVPIRLQQRRIKDIIDPIKRIFGQKGMFISERTKLQNARQVEISFFDYLIHTQLRLNNRLKDLLLDTNTAVATQLKDIQDNSPRDSEIANNPIILELLAASQDKEFAPKNIRLKTRDNEAYTSDIYTAALRELRENALTEELYYNLVKLTLLQTGTGKSRYSFTHLIPVEDYSKVMAPLLLKFPTLEHLELYRDNYAFFRGNWKNDDIVPKMDVRWRERQLEYGIMDMEIINGFPVFNYESFSYTNVPYEISRLHHSGGDTNISFIAPSVQYNSKLVNYPVIKVESVGINPKTSKYFTKKEKEEMDKRKDYGYKQTIVYGQVRDENDEPLTHTTAKGDTVMIYKQINAWGAGQNGIEYYEDTRPSVIENDSARIENEIPDEQIVAAYRGKEYIPQPKALNNPNAINFDNVSLDSVKRGSKKDFFPIASEGELGEAEGYTVTIQEHPDLDLYVTKFKKSWFLINAKTGLEISSGKTAKDAIAFGVERLNEIIEKGRSNQALKEFGLTPKGDFLQISSTFEEFKNSLNRKDC